jgi:2-hydroxy-6-oxonona-2,4-dienedioate hydrolase
VTLATARARARRARQVGSRARTLRDRSTNGLFIDAVADANDHFEWRGGVDVIALHVVYHKYERFVFLNHCFLRYLNAERFGSAHATRSFKRLLSPSRTVTRTPFFVALLLISLLVSIALGASLAINFRYDMRMHAERVARGSELVQTKCGTIEYAESGSRNGPVLFVIHGSGGGFDQGLTLGRDYAARGYRVIAPSRFGYLRTPFPADSTNALSALGETQADNLACLLDTLGIANAAVLGVSAGGISALHLAVRHPARVRALVLLVPAVYRPDPSVPLPEWAKTFLTAILKYDFPFWAVARFAPGTARRIVLATPASAYDAANNEEKARADTMLREIMPVSLRARGIVNDSALTTNAARVNLEAIRAPTLTISARDDGYGTYESARYTAAHIPGAKFLGFETGGHLVLGRQNEVTTGVHSVLLISILRTDKSTSSVNSLKSSGVM